MNLVIVTALCAVASAIESVPLVKRRNRITDCLVRFKSNSAETSDSNDESTWGAKNILITHDFESRFGSLVSFCVPNGVVSGRAEL